MSGNAPSIHAQSLDDAAYRSQEMIERAEAAEAAQAAIDRERDARLGGFEKKWRALRVVIARALGAPPPADARGPVAPAGSGESRVQRPGLPGQKRYSQPFVDGQREALEMIAARMKEMEEGR